MTLDRSHIPKLPSLLFYMRLAQLPVSIVVLGLSAYVVSHFAYSGASLSLFTAITTVIIVIYYIVVATVYPVFFNYWAVIGLDIFALIFWLVSFTLLASEAASWTITTNFGDICAFSTTEYCYRKRPLVNKRSNNHRTYRNAMAASAGLGALEFTMFFVTLGFTALAVLKHRRMGGHSTPDPEPDLLAIEQRDQELLAPPLE